MMDGQLGIPIIVVGNKSDLPYKVKNAREVCSTNNLPYLEVSALLGRNVKEIFHTALTLILKKRKQELLQSQMRLKETQEAKKKSRFCTLI